jgi:hypothetical protein
MANALNDNLQQMATPEGALNLVAHTAWHGSPNLLDGTLTKDSASKVIDEHLNAMSDKAESLGHIVSRGSSNVSGSRYLTFHPEEGGETYQVRISNHGDRYPNQLAGDGERFSVDPESHNSIQDAYDWLTTKGIDLSKTPPKKVPQKPLMYGEKASVINNLRQSRGGIPLTQDEIIKNGIIDDVSHTFGQQPWSADLSNYAGQHRPPMYDNGGAPLHDLTGGGQVYPDDIYSPKARQYYGTGDANDAQLFRQIQLLKGKPDAMVTAYRAVPKNVPANAINHGDWVTINKQYAIDHGESALNGEYKILEGKYPAKALFTNGDSPYEYGLDTSILERNGVATGQQPFTDDLLSQFKAQQANK